MSAPLESDAPTDPLATTTTAAAAASPADHDEAAAAAAAEARKSPEPPNVAAPARAVLGIDVGSQKAVVAAARTGRKMPWIVLNNLSSSATPSLVAFRNGERFIGEDAVSVLSMAPQTTAAQLPRLLGARAADLAAEPLLTVRVRAAKEGAATGVVVELDDAAGGPLAGEELYASFLSRLVSFARASIAQSDTETAPPPLTGAVLTLPTTATPAAYAAVKAAARIAQLPVLDVVGALDAVSVLYGNTQEFSSEGSHVLFVDVGHAHTQIQLTHFLPNALRVLARGGLASFGARDYDHAIAEQLFDAWSGKHKGEDLRKNLKAKVRVYKEAEKAKQILSTIGECIANLSTPEADMSVKLARATVEEKMAERLAELAAEIKAVIARAGVSPTAVQVIGGGCRIPSVCVTLAAAAGVDVAALGHHLDGASAVADGAALYASLLDSDKYAPTFIREESVEESIYSDDEIEKKKTCEEEKQKIDHINEERKSLANTLESNIYSSRSLIKSLSAIPSAEASALLSILEKEEEWHGDNALSSSPDELKERLSALSSALFSASATYKKHVDEIEQKKKQELLEMREKQQKEKEERAKEGGEKKSRRPKTNVEKIALAQKYKTQANSYFSDCDYVTAAAKWIESLGEVNDCYDITPQQEEEIKAIKISVQSNLAMAYLKLNLPIKAISNATKVLELDPKNVKALFRRGQGYLAQKKHDEAKMDFEKCVELEPDNKAAQQEVARIKKHLAEQAAKQREMYAAMMKAT